MPDQIPDFLTQHDIARILRLDHRTVEQWRGRKKGPPYYRLGGLRGNVVYDTAEFLSWLAQQRIDHGSLPAPVSPAEAGQ